MSKKEINDDAVNNLTFMLGMERLRNRGLSSCLVSLRELLALGKKDSLKPEQVDNMIMYIEEVLRMHLVDY